MSADRPFILVVGVQKSGTTLISRLLQQTGACVNPFEHEGDNFWGNVPVFSPAAFPAGTIYQRTGGENGHEIGVNDATDEVRQAMRDRLMHLPATSQVILNKNPYNTVRLPWLRALFPDACILAMIRDPVANVYSLTKKFIPHPGRGQPPEQGWWGVKPRGWRTMVSDDKVVQCARQWKAVNRRMLDDAACIDLLIGYRQLCESPLQWIQKILSKAIGQAAQLLRDIPPIRCFDHEYSRGSRLQSKNRYFRTAGSLEVPTREAVELDPLSDEQISAIQSICRETANDCAELR